MEANMFGNPEEKFLKRSNLQSDWEKRALQQFINREKALNASSSSSNDEDSFTQDNSKLKKQSISRVEG